MGDWWLSLGTPVNNGNCPCVHGACTSSSICTCDLGWVGPLCNYGM